MEYIKLGNTELKSSRLGFGCSQIASLSTAHSPHEVKATLLEAFDRGINFYDTADVYGQGDSERLLGKVFKANRSEVILCTKAGLTLSMSQAVIKMMKPFVRPLLRKWKQGRHRTLAARKQVETKCFEPNYLKSRIESSLRRLGTDYLDVFLLHSPPKESILDNTVFEMMEDLKNKGVLRYYGVSCDSAEDAMLCMQRDGIACLQVTANVMEHEVVNRILPLARTKGIGIISREPFAGGRVFSHAPVQHVCQKRKDYSPARAALQYMLQREDTGVVLIGMTCRGHLMENVQAFNPPHLSTDDIKILQKEDLGGQQSEIDH